MKVVGKSKDGNGETMVSCDPNLFLITLNYDIEFPNGKIKEHSINVSAINMRAQEDDDGHAMKILDSIVDHKKDSNEVDTSYACLLMKSRKHRLRHKTSGWSLLIL